MAKKNVENVINMTKENGNTAVVEVLKGGKVDVTIKNHDMNVTVIHHYDDVSAMTNAMNELGYSTV